MNLCRGLNRSLCRILTFSAALLLAGCAGYQLGPTNGTKAGERSVSVNPFINQTMEPRLTDAVTQQLRKQLQRDGTFRLSSHGDSDVIVSGRITHYDRLELSFSSTDVLTVVDYRLRIIAVVTARNRTSGKIILDELPITGTTLIRVGNDLASSERQALPLLADDLAKNVTALLADGTW